MRRLLNTLFVQTENAYLTLDGENIAVMQDQTEIGRLPLHNLEAILCFSYAGASPALMGACVRQHIALSFFTPRGRYLAQVRGEQSGNVLLRRQQYRVSDEAKASAEVARGFLLGKLYNSRQVLLRAVRDHELRLDVAALRTTADGLKAMLPEIAVCTDLQRLRGLEGNGAAAYFEHFDQLILQQKNDFFYHRRSRRPPLDNTNALLSLTYSLLAQTCTAALESVGLDPQIGFLHQDRPGRASLALDLMEELRPIYADRFVLKLINDNMIQKKHFQQQESGGVYLTPDGRKVLFTAWQNKKKEIFMHAYLKEKLPWGLVPYVQALLLARFLRGDLDAYPPFFWR